MYYIKYRPQNVEDLDNKNVRTQLERILKSDPIPHAFLFTGPKGTGKTSAARIIAKVLNCDENSSGTIKTLKPKSDDHNVKAITKGVSPDVIEMDAASNRKIDDIRNLIGELKFSPITSRYKIYI
jgi:DNA polymerase-3 subunit gamma/tau